MNTSPRTETSPLSDEVIDRDFAERGYTIVPDVFDAATIERLRSAFFKSAEFCSVLQRRYGIESDTRNTCHHVLFLDPVYAEVITNETFLHPVRRYFEGYKFVLHSLGTINNDGHVNHASKIHRDQRFISADRVKLNTLIAVSDLTPEKGSTEILPASQEVNDIPDEGMFVRDRVQISCPAGGVIYFDSRLWHRAGRRTTPTGERIIVTPLFTRPFLKPGFNYVRALEQNGLQSASEMLKQLCGYFSDVPNSHEEWYNVGGRQYYRRDQDV